MAFEFRTCSVRVFTWKSTYAITLVGEEFGYGMTLDLGPGIHVPNPVNADSDTVEVTVRVRDDAKCKTYNATLTNEDGVAAPLEEGDIEITGCPEPPPEKKPSGAGSPAGKAYRKPAKRKPRQ